MFAQLNSRVFIRRTFNVVAPKVAVPGQRTAVLVSWNPACSPKDVTLRLLRQLPSTAEQQRTADDDVLSHNTVTINGQCYCLQNIGPPSYY